jgi:hypothetical protein
VVLDLHLHGRRHTGRGAEETKMMKRRRVGRGGTHLATLIGLGWACVPRKSRPAAVSPTVVVGSFAWNSLLKKKGTPVEKANGSGSNSEAQIYLFIFFGWLPGSYSL